VYRGADLLIYPLYLNIDRETTAWPADASRAFYARSRGSVGEHRRVVLRRSGNCYLGVSLSFLLFLEQDCNRESIRLSTGSLLTLEILMCRFPSVPNPTAGEMNYASLMFGTVALLSAFHYAIYGRKYFDPPLRKENF
jgi:hypothetical protein